MPDDERYLEDGGHVEFVPPDGDLDTSGPVAGRVVVSASDRPSGASFNR